MHGVTMKSIDGSETLLIIKYIPELLTKPLSM